MIMKKIITDEKIIDEILSRGVEDIIVKEDLKTNKAKTTETKVLAITHTIPKSKKDEISLTKIASIAHSLTNAPKSIPGYAVKTEKEPARRSNGGQRLVDDLLGESRRTGTVSRVVRDSSLDDGLHHHPG